MHTKMGSTFTRLHERYIGWGVQKASIDFLMPCGSVVRFASAMVSIRYQVLVPTCENRWEQVGCAEATATAPKLNA